MSELMWIALAVVIVAVVAVAVYTARRRRTLKDRFGPEYERAVDESGSRLRAESELKSREKRRSKLDIKPLSIAAHDRYARSWQDLQARFVDAPQDSVRDADELVVEVMRERGYPMESFDQRSADISVDHPNVVHNYRAAHAISMANARGRATTEDLRQAMVYYRSLFEELLHSDADDRTIDLRDSEGAEEPIDNRPRR